MGDVGVRLGRRIIVSTWLMVIGTSALAGSFCDDLGVLAQQGDAPVTLPGGTEDQLADCRTALSLGGGQDAHCSWIFGYRSEAAKDAFKNVIGAVTLCLGPDAIHSTDKLVNHPDAYDLRLFRVDGQDFAVSLKDKGALQQSLIFLRVPLTGKP